MKKINKTPYFLPYQLRWLADQSPVKVWEKSRRIGATYVQSYEDVRDIIQGNVPAVWFSSADESAAKEYILYCMQWSSLFAQAASDLGETVISEQKDHKTFQLTFANGKRITALSSNPKAFRSKGGKVVLDEFAHHDDPYALWKAAKPAITWGFPIRILSTHNGKQNLFYRFVQDICNHRLEWSLHSTPIGLAVEEGLVAKILNRRATEEDNRQWLTEQRLNCFDEVTWNEEFCCIPVDEATAFLSYDLITACEVGSDKMCSRQNKNNPLFLGFDIGRKHDLSVIWILEKDESVLVHKDIITMKNKPFAEQYAILSSMLASSQVMHCCIDQTGIGMQLAEDLAAKFGKHKVEGIMFTQPKKEELAYLLKRHFEERKVIIPADHEIREDLHSVIRIPGERGIRFDVNSQNNSHHADRFWALALAVYASLNEVQPMQIYSGKKKPSREMMKGYI